MEATHQRKGCLVTFIFMFLFILYSCIPIPITLLKLLCGNGFTLVDQQSRAFRIHHFGLIKSFVSHWLHFQAYALCLYPSINFKYQMDRIIHFMVSDKCALSRDTSPQMGVIMWTFIPSTNKFLICGFLGIHHKRSIGSWHPLTIKLCSS